MSMFLSCLPTKFLIVIHHDNSLIVIRVPVSLYQSIMGRCKFESHFNEIRLFSIEEGREPEFHSWMQKLKKLLSNAYREIVGRACTKICPFS